VESAVGGALGLLFLGLFFTHGSLRDNMRADHPLAADPARGYVHAVTDKVTFYVTDEEYWTLSALFYGYLTCFAGMMFVGYLAHRDDRKPH
jgi:hypothetical protein